MIELPEKLGAALMVQANAHGVSADGYDFGPALRHQDRLDSDCGHFFAGTRFVDCCFANVLNQPFGQYQQEGAALIFRQSYAAACLTFISTIVGLNVMTKFHALVQLAAWLVLYSLINGVTMVKNTADLARLPLAFDKEVRKLRILPPK